MWGHRSQRFSSLKSLEISPKYYTIIKLNFRLGIVSWTKKKACGWHFWTNQFKKPKESWNSRAMKYWNNGRAHHMFPRILKLQNYESMIFFRHLNRHKTQEAKTQNKSVLLVLVELITCFHEFWNYESHYLFHEFLF